MVDSENLEYAPLSLGRKPQTYDMRFTGSDSFFSKLVRNGALLEIITFGLYRFWLATDIRKYLWSHTKLDDDAFVYHGTAAELMIGFLLAFVVFSVAIVAVIDPLTLALVPSGSAASGLFSILFLQFALYRAHRYRLNRTSWRGVRFGMEGSGVSYALRAVGWSLLTILTLGLTLPWLQAGLERYKMRNTYYGNLSGDFVATGGALFRRGWTLWLGSIAIAVAYVSMVVVMQLIGVEEKLFSNLIKYHLFILPPSLVWTIVLSPLFLLAAIYVFGKYKCILWHWWVEGLRLDRIWVRSSLKSGLLVQNYFVYAAFVTLTVFLFLGGAWQSIGILIDKNTSALGLALLLTLIYATIIALATLWRIYCIQRVWKIVVNSLTIHNIDIAEEVTMRPEARMPTALSEGFLDSLDLDGF